MMTRYLLLAACLVLAVGSRPVVAQDTPERIVAGYIGALNASNFDTLASLLSDSLLVAEVFAGEENVLSRTRSDFHRIFRWDSVFSPVYGLQEMVTNGSTVEAIVSKTCKRIAYLHNDPILYRAVFSTEGDQIVAIRRSYITFELEMWTSRRDRLVSWIDEHHPELAGFVFDQTISGARNYISAIDLYRRNH